MVNRAKKDQLVIFREHCRNRSLRVTPQRTAIYEELCRCSNHPSAEQVYLQIKTRFTTISLNTVNETLLTFSQIGLINIIEAFGSPRRYDPNLETHHHIHCTDCGTILDFYDDSFNRIKPPEKIARSFEILSTKVVMTGICRKCKKKRTSETNKI